jgi:asparagine synthase (glutamine-hydrolysing)
MCGIVGILKDDPTWSVSSDALAEMCSVISHRGPDDEGYFVDGAVGLGMRRLSIIDVQGGHQPIHNETKDCWIVFNGEIYNYPDLRQVLLTKGHQFATKSDTEAIIHLYEEYGEECVKYLRGMFAFAIWDKKARKVFIARDRIGEKPLYYTHQNGRFAFASELKSLLVLPDIDKTLDLEALRDYFSFLYVPTPRSIFGQIKKLPAAHTLTIQNGRMSIQRYWGMMGWQSSVKSEKECVEELLDLVRESVRIRLMSEVPLGAFLSGGVDSSIVVAAMSEILEKPVETFTMGFEQGKQHYDERPYAGIVARHCSTLHREFVASPDIGELLPKIIRAFDEPFADSSAIPNYVLCKNTREYVTVALSGLGGDELSCGYERYLGMKIARIYEKCPSLVKGFLRRAANMIPDAASGSLLSERIKRFVRAGNLPEQRRYFEMIAAFNEAEKRELFSIDALGSVNGSSEDLLWSYFQGCDSSDIVDHMLFVDVNTYLVDDLLTLTDRISMAHSLEMRVPLIDHKLVEFFASVPSTMRLRGLTKKYILKKAAEQLVPREVIYRRKKGFSVPLSLWLRNELRDLVQEELSEKRLRQIGYFNHKTVSKTVQEHLSGRHNHENKIWALLNFVLWHRMYVEEPLERNVPANRALAMNNTTVAAGRN